MKPSGYEIDYAVHALVKMTNMTPQEIEQTMNFEDLTIRSGFEAFDAEVQKKLIENEMRKHGGH